MSKRKEEDDYRDERKKKRNRRRSDSSDDEKHREKRSDRRDKYRDRDYEDDYRKDKSRKNRKRSYSKSSDSNEKERRPRVKEEGEADKYMEQKVEIANMDELEEEDLIHKMMGFADFSTSKGKNHLHSSEEHTTKINRTKRQYRQYMNKKAATNRNEPIHM